MSILTPAGTVAILTQGRWAFHDDYFISWPPAMNSILELRRPCCIPDLCEIDPGLSTRQCLFQFGFHGQTGAFSFSGFHLNSSILSQSNPFVLTIFINSKALQLWWWNVDNERADDDLVDDDGVVGVLDMRSGTAGASV